MGLRRGVIACKDDNHTECSDSERDKRKGVSALGVRARFGSAFPHQRGSNSAYHPTGAGTEWTDVTAAG